MAKNLKLTIRNIERFKGKIRIVFSQRSVPPYETSQQNANRFNIGDSVKFHGNKLVKC